MNQGHRLAASPLFVWCLLSSGAARLHAQHPDSVVVLPAIEVIGSIHQSAVGPSVRAGSAGRFLSISRNDLRDWRPGLASNALEQVGASLYDDLGSPFKQSVVLRGFTVGPIVGMPQGISVFVDGVPMNELGSGDVAFDLLPLEHVERIEVLTGTASLLGPNSLGGAINLITKRGVAASSIELTAGSHGLRAAVGATGGRVRDWDYYLGAGHETEAGWRRRMDGDRSHVYTSVGRYAQHAGVRVQLLASRSHAQTAGSLPLSVYVVQPDSNLTAGDFELLRQLQLALSGYLRAFGGLASARIFARVNDAERFNANQAADPDVRGFTESETFGVEADYRAHWSLGTSALALRFGGGASANRTEVELFAERITPGQTTHVRSPIGRLDGYALGDWQWQRLTLSAGTRLDVVRVPFRNLRNPARDTTSMFRHWSPRAALDMAITPQWSAYLSAGKGFRAPSLIEIACADPQEPCPLPFALGDDPPIKPVRVVTYEAGVRKVSGRFQGDVAIYSSDVSDDIFLFPYDDDSEPSGSTIDGYFGNIPRTRRQGIELTGRFRIAEGLRAHAGYTLARATFESDDVEIFSIREAGGAQNEVAAGDRFPLVPAHTFWLQLDGEHGNFRFGAATRWIGERYLRGDEANDEPPLDAYLTTDVRASHQTGRWQISLLLRNATNARYATFGGFNINQAAGERLERFLTPGRPRGLELTARVVF